MDTSSIWISLPNHSYYVAYGILFCARFHSGELMKALTFHNMRCSWGSWVIAAWSCQEEELQLSLKETRKRKDRKIFLSSQMLLCVRNLRMTLVLISYHGVTPRWLKCTAGENWASTFSQLVKGTIHEGHSTHWRALCHHFMARKFCLPLPERLFHSGILPKSKLHFVNSCRE